MCCWMHACMHACEHFQLALFRHMSKSKQRHEPVCAETDEVVVTGDFTSPEAGSKIYRVSLATGKPCPCVPTSASLAMVQAET